MMNACAAGNSASTAHFHTSVPLVSALIPSFSILSAFFFVFFFQYLEQPRSAGFVMCLLGNMASGGAAGATSLLVVYPLDFARTRLAMDVGAGKAREFTGTFDCILKTAKASGWGKGGVYNGFVVSCVGIIAYRGAYFGLYDTCADIEAMRGAGFAAKFALGYSVTVTAGLISYPLDTIRRRMMMTSGGKDAGKYKSSIDCGAQVLKNEGVKAMYKGASANILRGLAGALVLVSFDYCKNYYLEWKYPELKGSDTISTCTGQARWATLLSRHLEACSHAMFVVCACYCVA